jgi:hypothetical protein
LGWGSSRGDANQLEYRKQDAARHSAKRGEPDESAGSLVCLQSRHHAEQLTGRQDMRVGWAGTTVMVTPASLAGANAAAADVDVIGR